jgi:hypothetical protein
MTDQELKDLISSLAIAQQEIAKTQQEEIFKIQQETAKIQQETTKTQQEATKAQQETAKVQEAEIFKMQQETIKIQQETIKIQKEVAEYQQETNKQIRELKKQIGGIANKFGSFTEGLALPSMTKILSEKFGMTTINPSVRVRNAQGLEQEIDVLAYANGDINTAFIVEVKSHLREEGIEQLLKQLRDFPVLFPELASKKLYGILAAVDANSQLQQRVLAEGLYFAKIHDEQFSLRVPKNFQPRCFNS